MTDRMRWRSTSSGALLSVGCEPHGAFTMWVDDDGLHFGVDPVWQPPPLRRDGGQVPDVTVEMIQTDDGTPSGIERITEITAEQVVEGITDGRMGGAMWVALRGIASELWTGDRFPARRMLGVVGPIAAWEEAAEAAGFMVLKDRPS